MPLQRIKRNNYTINKSIIGGNYAEIFKAKDSAIITQALAINIIENDSLYIHADTLVELTF